MQAGHLPIAISPVPSFPPWVTVSPGSPTGLGFLRPRPAMCMSGSSGSSLAGRGAHGEQTGAGFLPGAWKRRPPRAPAALEGSCPGRGAREAAAGLVRV